MDRILEPVYAQTDDGTTVVVTFREPVTGIDASSATLFLRPYQLNDFEWSEPGPPVEGTWACQDGVGAATDCGTGSVSTAVFNVTGDGSWDTVELNPDHELSVRDLAGNPFDHTWVGVWGSTERTPSHTASAAPRSCGPLMRGLVGRSGAPDRASLAELHRCLASGIVHRSR